MNPDDMLERIVRLEETDKDQSDDIEELKKERESNRAWRRGPLLLALLTLFSVLVTIILAIGHFS